jgi:hypothetical protein
MTINPALAILLLSVLSWAVVLLGLWAVYTAASAIL